MCRNDVFEERTEGLNNVVGGEEEGPTIVLDVNKQSIFKDI